MSTSRDPRASPQPVADGSPRDRAAHHARHGRRLFVVHHRPDRRPAAAADRPHRSQPPRLAAAAAHPERPEPARAGHARHARRRAAVSARSPGRRSSNASGPISTTRCARARRSPLAAPHARAAAVPGQLGRAVLGRRRPHVRPWRPPDDDDEARTQVRVSLQARQAALDTAVARLLVAEQRGRGTDRASRCRTSTRTCSGRSTGSSLRRWSPSPRPSLYLIRSNRRLFARAGGALRRAARAGAAADRDARIDLAATSRASCTTSSASC